MREERDLGLTSFCGCCSQDRWSRPLQYFSISDFQYFLRDDLDAVHSILLPSPCRNASRL